MAEFSKPSKLCPKLLGVDQSDAAWLGELRETRVQDVANGRSYGRLTSRKAPWPQLPHTSEPMDCYPCKVPSLL